jgi:heterodisulfide reductase subunit C
MNNVNINNITQHLQALATQLEHQRVSTEADRSTVEKYVSDIESHLLQDIEEQRQIVLSAFDEMTKAVQTATNEMRSFMGTSYQKRVEGISAAIGDNT